MKLRETISWLRGTLPRQLFPRREECGERPLTDKEQQLISILALGQLEQFVAPSLPQRFGRKRPDRRARGRALVAQAVYNHPFTCSTPEAGRTSRGVQRLGGYGLWGQIPSESVFSRAWAASCTGTRWNPFTIGCTGGCSQPWPGRWASPSWPDRNR
jgi:hypothetical protein